MSQRRERCVACGKHRIILGDLIVHAQVLSSTQILSSIQSAEPRVSPVLMLNLSHPLCRRCFSAAAAGEPQVHLFSRGLVRVPTRRDVLLAKKREEQAKQALIDYGDLDYAGD